jgi:hypothetical protein
VRLLRRHREAQDMERMLAGETWEDNDLVSCKDVTDRCTHLMEKTHQAAAEQTAAYVLGDDGTS